MNDQMKREVLRQQLKLVDTVELKHIRNGKVIGVRSVKLTPGMIEDIVTNVGKAQIAGLINGEVTDVFKYVAIGTGTTGAQATDTALESEITTGGGARALGTTSRVTTTVTNDTAQVQLTYNFTATFAVTESGLFDAASAGNMVCRQTFSAINVISGDSLQITWKLQVQ